LSYVTANIICYSRLFNLHLIFCIVHPYCSFLPIDFRFLF